ncbi:MAG: nitrous oxide reductase family maturation protein NosD [Gammaproteobacteria bacterium]|nr:nitrous oxide reductase family maturation protein NosD [Gammaproteobacteria bacterium]MDH5731481.1 nitrous oxide reductase family maturation protein NosD [Gammaproteobacteria bacterium]
MIQLTREKIHIYKQGKHEFYKNFIHLVWIIFFVPLNLQAATLVVPNANAKTIQQAINQARAGDKLIIKPGHYQEHLVINKAIHLSSKQTSSVTIDGAHKGRVIEVKSANVIVEGLNIINSGEEIDNTDTCIYIHQNATNVEILENNLSHCTFGIWVHGTINATIKGNQISGIKQQYFSDMGNGINIWSAKNILVQDNQIFNVRDGIYLTVTTQSSVKDNSMHNVRFGIHYMYNDDNTIEGNKICDSMVGLAMMYSKRLQIKNNQALNNKNHGILFRSIYDSTIENNIASNNNKGFFLNDSSFNQFQANLLQHNKTGVHVTAGSEDNIVFANDFVNNPIQINYTQQKNQFWDNKQRGNYWSDYLGWDFNQDSTGDKVYYASNRVDQLVFQYPQVKLLAQSPVVILLQNIESKFPILRPPTVVDRFPSMHRHIGKKKLQSAHNSPQICHQDISKTNKAKI